MFPTTESFIRGRQSLIWSINISNFMEPEVHYSIHKNPLKGPVLNQSKQVYTVVSILILWSHLCFGIRSGLRPSHFQTNFYMRFSSLLCVAHDKYFNILLNSHLSVRGRNANNFYSHSYPNGFGTHSEILTPRAMRVEIHRPARAHSLQSSEEAWSKAYRTVYGTVKRKAKAVPVLN
jgi:hypothetical protein